MRAGALYGICPRCRTETEVLLVPDPECICLGLQPCDACRSMLLCRGCARVPRMLRL